MSDKIKNPISANIIHFLVDSGASRRYTDITIWTDQKIFRYIRYIKENLIP